MVDRIKEIENIKEKIKNEKLKSNSKEKINKNHGTEIIKRIKSIITKINTIKNNENKKDKESILDRISSLKSQINKRFNELNHKTTSKQIINSDDGKYIGQIKNGVKEGRGIYYYINNNR